MILKIRKIKKYHKQILIFCIGLLSIWYVSVYAHDTKNNIQLVKKMLAAKAHFQTEQVLNLLDDKIAWTSALSKKFQGKNKVKKFLSFLKTHQATSKLTAGPIFQENWIQVTQKVYLDFFKKLKIPFLYEQDKIFIDHQKITVWKAKFIKINPQQLQALHQYVTILKRRQAS